MPSGLAAAPQQFLHGNIKDTGAGTKFLFQVIHPPSAQRLLSEDSGKEQWDSYRIPDMICNFLLFLNLFSLSTCLPGTVFVPFPKVERLDGSDSPFAVDFLLFSPVFNSFLTRDFRLARCSVYPSESPLTEPCSPGLLQIAGMSQTLPQPGTCSAPNAFLLTLHVPALVDRPAKMSLWITQGPH